VRAARSAEALVELARRQAPRCVLIDLHNPGLDLADLLRRLGEVCPTPPRVVGYGSHVDADRLRAARAAGCDPVLPRSKFVEELPAALPGWLGAERGCGG
jgi:CheY-like chemotaxis protein